VAILERRKDMKPISTISKVAQPFLSVKSLDLSTFSLPSDTLIHHKASANVPSKIIVTYNKYRDKRYGVSSTYRILSKSLLIKKFDLVRDCLKYALGLSTAQRHIILELLRFHAYYGLVYPKESTITDNPPSSKATFFRAIRNLKERGLITVTNRYVIRPHSQISNLYRLDKLLLVIAHYLAEHGVGFFEEWLQPWLGVPGHSFWPEVAQNLGDRAGP
jgi:hypothetical protein